jgi:hypothetical protein
MRALLNWYARPPPTGPVHVYSWGPSDLPVHDLQKGWAAKCDTLRLTRVAGVRDALDALKARVAGDCMHMSDDNGLFQNSKPRYYVSFRFLSLMRCF